MTTLYQLKNRIAWEIQTLRDRHFKIVETRERRRAFGIAADERDRDLEKEAARINERIQVLEALNKGRRTLKVLRRKLQRVQAVFRQSLKDEIWKVSSVTTEVRRSLGI